MSINKGMPLLINCYHYLVGLFLIVCYWVLKRFKSKNGLLNKLQNKIEYRIHKMY